jgi:hypothetical protein
MFIPAAGSPLQNLTAACQVTEIYSGDANSQLESAMLDTVEPDTVKAGTVQPSAITLFASSQTQTIYAGPWHENAIPSLTLSGALAPNPGTAALAAAEEWQVDKSDDFLLPGGSVFLALAVVATFAALRLHKGART